MLFLEIIDCLREINEKNHNDLSITDRAALLYCEQSLNDSSGLLRSFQKENPEEAEKYLKSIRGCMLTIETINFTSQYGPVSGVVIHNDREKNKKSLLNAIEIYKETKGYQNSGN